MDFIIFKNGSGWKSASNYTVKDSEKQFSLPSQLANGNLNREFYIKMKVFKMHVLQLSK